ncbi:DUF4179 domain-containing protein [Mesobacillus subterraneus]|uniref:DUF4179 domain-containing protein n=1 Tax=Mesobacillus subterraneus TaxID=285983 RepID=UPI0014748603|nr:DUF4179 domain-containing protein [Mesobacillus subterraneus]
MVDWFGGRLGSFYRLGWFYLGDPQRVEELFYRSIVRVHRELPRFKNDVSFDLWVTSVFIENCRVLSLDGGKQDSKLHIALENLESAEKEAFLLTYVKGFSHEETEYILRGSTEKVKELLFTAIQTVRQQLDGGTYLGCGKYRKHYLDYLEKSMDRPKKIEFEKHLYHCYDCQDDLASFQDVTVSLMDESRWDVDVPDRANFMENVQKRLTEKDEHSKRKKKKRLRMGLVFTSVFAVIFGLAFITGAFHYAYYGLTEEDEALRVYLQKGLGERVNLEAENNGVKVKITGVVADEVQTLVFYKIEDTSEDSQYFMNYEDGLYVENENEIMSHETYPGFILPDLETNMNKRESNVYYGKVALRPLREENGTMKIRASKLTKLMPADPSVSFLFNQELNYKNGEWVFEVPVTKRPSIEYVLNGQTEIEGVPVRFEKLILAPTATILRFGIQAEKPERRLDFVNLGDLEVNDKTFKADRYSGAHTYLQPAGNWNPFQTHYGSLFGEKPKEVKVRFESAYFTFEDDKVIELDVNQEYPQTFEYAGSTISIDKIEVGRTTSFVISNHDVQNRGYESLHLNLIGENEQDIQEMQMYGKSIIVDKNGVEYDTEKIGPLDFEKIEQPRHFLIDQTIKLSGDNPIPKKLIISGYNTMKYLDQEVKLTVQ